MVAPCRAVLPGLIIVNVMLIVEFIFEVAAYARVRVGF